MTTLISYERIRIAIDIYFFLTWFKNFKYCMDNKKFIEIINECCEWYYPKVPDVGNQKWTNHSSTTGPRREELGPQILKYKSITARHCEWCNKQRPIKRLHQKLWVRGKYQGWKHRCLTCNKKWDEETKQLINGTGRSVD